MKEKRFTIGKAINYIMVFLVTLMCAYPFLNVVACSFSSVIAVTSKKVSIFPVEFNLEAYEKIFGMKQLWLSFKVTFNVVVLGTLLGLILTVTSAYALSKERLRGRRIINVYILFTMYFGAGMMPTFLVVKTLGLYNNYGGLILPGVLSAYNFIVMRTFFREISKDLQEAALLDGAGDIVVLLKIVLPISKPILATIGLFIAVAYWNDYFSALIYTQTEELYTLQLRLRSILIGGSLNSNSIQAMNNASSQALSVVIRRAVIVVSTVPIVILYPWLQKYFVKGVMLGSVKG